MRRLAWVLLLIFAFTIPWEYSLNLGEPLGNVARIAGLLLLLVAIPAVLQAGRLRTPGPMQWLVLVFYLWMCCSYFWSIAPAVTLDKMRGYFQEMMIVWLVWEFAESPHDLRALMRAYVAGSCLLAILTLSHLGFAQATAADQIRFVAEGQDANDMARYLDLGFPMAALLVNSERRWAPRLLALGYFPLGLTAVLLTASREGFVAAVIALGGCAVLLYRRFGRTVLTAAAVLPAIAGGLWLTVPHETLQRLATIPEELHRGDLNQRWNIWSVGWQAFVQSPILGTGAGSFVSAAGLNPVDTAHNTALSILADSGLCGLFIAAGILLLAARATLQARGSVRQAFLTALLVWTTTCLVATAEENRSTWLLFGLIASAGWLATEQPEELNACFSPGESGPAPQVARHLARRPAESV